ncbi:MAG: hypothetical protein NC548_65175 [Lachnospiraceae bacterium]|nr:hypothetical protein [Lachnospiraceae bacterium]
MDKNIFKAIIADRADDISSIRARAHAVHDSVNQHYDRTRPYGYHLDMVAKGVEDYAASVCQDPGDVLPLIFGAFFHDSIEDARLTYNDVLAIAREYFPEDKAILATEIVYALTNEKGRTRAERASEKYYSGIRLTPYAPLVKLADRLANTAYSSSHSGCPNSSMREVYRHELPHFLSSIQSPLAASDPRFALPQDMVRAINSI